jgi:hypothetical protein
LLGRGDGAPRVRVGGRPLDQVVAQRDRHVGQVDDAVGELVHRTVQQPVRRPRREVQAQRP